MGVKIEDLKKRNRPEQIAITEHARRRLTERGITVGDIIQCINNGEIIKQYEDDRPFPSCLILGTAMNGELIHTVVSHDDVWIYLITAYYPDSDIWEPGFRVKGVSAMRCQVCGATAEKGLTTNVTDLGKCLIIVRNVPCYKCKECNEIIYTGDVVQHLERMIEAAKNLMQEVSIIDYSKAA